MICELYKFFGLLPPEFEDFEFAKTITFKPEELTDFNEAVNLFVECEFVIQNPAGLTDIEKVQYFLEKSKFRLKSYKQKALIEREIANIPAGIDTTELFKEISPKQKALDRMSRMAVSRE